MSEITRKGLLDNRMGAKNFATGAREEERERQPAGFNSPLAPIIRWWSHTATCPKCGNKVPAGKLLRLTRFSPHTTCPTCSSKLKSENLGTGTLIGGVGGGVGGGLGALFASRWVLTGNIVYLVLVGCVIVAVFLSAWGAMVKCVRFESSDVDMT